MHLRYDAFEISTICGVNIKCRNYLTTLSCLHDVSPSTSA